MTAIACATPKLRIVMNSETEKARKTEIMITAAPVTTWAVRSSPP